MKFISPGKWLEEALQIGMTTDELKSWMKGYELRNEKLPVEIALVDGKIRAHYYLVEKTRVIIYEENSD